MYFSPHSTMKKVKSDAVPFFSALSEWYQANPPKPEKGI